MIPINEFNDADYRKVEWNGNLGKWKISLHTAESPPQTYNPLFLALTLYNVELHFRLLEKNINYFNELVLLLF